MRILVFDTETVGLPENYKAPATDVNNWPRMVQLSWQVYDYSPEKMEAISEHNAISPTPVLISEDDYIIHCKFEIPKRAVSIHGITTEISQKKGFEIAIPLLKIGLHIAASDLIVGHNISFDKKVLGAEFIRLLGTDYLSGKEKLCTMNKTTKFCSIPHANRKGIKWPKLQELHKKLFGVEFGDAHNSLADVRATAKCFFRLIELGVIKVN